MRIIACEFPFVCKFCGVETRFVPDDFEAGRYIKNTRYWLTSNGFDVTCPVCKRTTYKVELKAEVVKE